MFSSSEQLNLQKQNCFNFQEMKFGKFCTNRASIYFTPLLFRACVVGNDRTTCFMKENNGMLLEEVRVDGNAVQT